MAAPIMIRSYLDAIHRMIPVLYDDLTTIVILYALEDLLPHLFTDLKITNDTRRDIKWLAMNDMLYESYNRRDYIHIRIDVCMVINGSQIRDRNILGMSLLHFIKCMNEMRMGRELIENISKRPWLPWVDTLSREQWKPICDQAAQEMDFAFAIFGRKIIERIA